MQSDELSQIPSLIKSFYPKCQAIYLFGSFGNGEQNSHSDVDIAILLPIIDSKTFKSIQFSACQTQLCLALRREVDLINLRAVSTVFQNEIVSSARLIDCQDRAATEEFEMLSLSLYQKLNEERKEILEEIMQSGRVLS